MGRSPQTRASVAVALCLLSAQAASQPPAPLVHPIPRVLRETPPEDVFGIQGYVAMASVCPPCPANADCATCPPPYIIVSSRNRRVEFPDQMKAHEVRLLTNMKGGFVRGAHYRFLIRRPTGAEAAQRAVFDLLEFEPVPVPNPSISRVEDPARVAIVRAAVESRLGRDVVLDHLPSGATLERGFRYLTTETRRELVRDALTGVPTIHGLELQLTFEEERLTVFAFSPRPDFEGELVYAVSRFGDEWPVFVRPPAEPGRRP